MSTIRVGFAIEPNRQEVDELEALPIDSLWVGGHVASPNPTTETMAKLARLAALSQRVRIGTAILLLPLYPPAIVAKQVADLDRATGGRVTLGVGVGGEYEQEFRACGVPVRERGRRADEAIPLLRRLWTAEEISHPGPFYPMERVRLHPAPVQAGGPPIVVAGRKPPAMARAARLGDGWMPYLYSPRAYAESVTSIRALAAEAGRDLTDFEWLQFVFVNVQDDADRAREEAAAFLGGVYSQDFGVLVDRVAAVGSPDQVAARLQQYADAGARHFIFLAASRTDRMAMMRRVLSDIVPQVAATDSPAKEGAP